MRWRAVWLGARTEAAGFRDTTWLDHEPVKRITGLRKVLLMVGADSVLVWSSFQAIAYRGDTPVIDVKLICWHQAIDSPTSCR